LIRRIKALIRFRLSAISVATSGALTVETGFVRSQRAQYGNVRSWASPVSADESVALICSTGPPQSRQRVILGSWERILKNSWDESLEIMTTPTVRKEYLNIQRGGHTSPPNSCNFVHTLAKWGIVGNSQVDMAISCQRTRSIFERYSIVSTDDAPEMEALALEIRPVRTILRRTAGFRARLENLHA
jgi:hypothetical protein